MTPDFCESESESESSVGPESQNQENDSNFASQESSQANDSQILRVKSRVKPMTLKFCESRVESIPIPMTLKFCESTQESTQELTRNIFFIFFLKKGNH